MKKCEICSRPLEFEEGKLCPACKSERSHKKKRVFEYIVGGATIIIGIIFGIGGGFGGGKRS